MVSTPVLRNASVLSIPVGMVVTAATSNPPWEMNSPLAILLLPIGVGAWIGCMRVVARHKQLDRPTFLIAVATLAFIIAEFLGSSFLVMLMFGSGIR